MGNDVQIVDSEILRAIGQHCTSLQHLELNFRTPEREGRAFEESYLQMLRDIGGHLKHFSMHAEWFDRTDALFRTIGESCPLLEGLITPTNTMPLASSTSSTETEVDTDGDTDRSGMVSAGALSDLIHGCKRLRWLGLPDPEAFCEPPFSLQLTETVRERVKAISGTVDENDEIYIIFQHLAAKASLSVADSQRFINHAFKNVGV